MRINPFVPVKRGFGQGAKKIATVCILGAIMLGMVLCGLLHKRRKRT